MFMRDPAADIVAMRHGRLVWAGLAVATTRVPRSCWACSTRPMLDIVGTAAAAIS
jgi:hypothetical protein